MPETEAPGLTADWLNGWLAAIGVTVLLPAVRVRWTTDAVPHAAFEHDHEPFEEHLTEALPTPEALSALVIAREHPDSDVLLPRNVPLTAFRQRAALARQRDDWSLSSSLTDLGRNDGEDFAEHSPFDPPAPRGETLHDRVIRCSGALGTDHVLEWVSRSLTGAGRRIQANGLGFDHRRLQASADASTTFVDPVVELLAFYGLSSFAIRGSGQRARTRGWTTAPSRRGAFTWPVWLPPLDRWAIDALLDIFYGTSSRSRALGVAGAYQTVPYEPKASADVTRAYAAERVR